MIRLSYTAGRRSWGVTFWRETRAPEGSGPGQVVSGSGSASLSARGTQVGRPRRSPGRSTVVVGFRGGETR